MAETAYERAARMWKKNAEILAAPERYIDPAQYQAVYEMILSCTGKVVTMGMGSSGIAAHKIAHMFCVSGFPAYYLSAGDCAHGDMGALGRGDVVIAISNGGATEEIIALLPSMQRKGVRLIAVTGKPDSVIGRAAEQVLQINVPESDGHNLATASFMAQTVTFDAIADELGRRPGYNEEELYYNHVHGGMGALWKESSGK